MAIAEYRSSDQYPFKKVSVVVDGVNQGTLQNVNYAVNVDRSEIFGQGGTPISIGEGNTTYNGSFTVLQSDLEDLIAKGFHKGYFNIQVEYQKGDSDPIVVDNIVNAKVMGFEKGMAQGDKNSEHSIDFIAMNIVFGSE